MLMGGPLYIMPAQRLAMSAQMSKRCSPLFLFIYRAIWTLSDGYARMEVQLLSVVVFVELMFKAKVVGHP